MPLNHSEREVYQSENLTHKTQKIMSLWDQWLKKYTDKRVALYGAGEHTLWLAKLLGSHFYKMPLTVIIDQHPKKNRLLDIPTVASPDFNWGEIDFVIISSESFEQEIFENLSQVIEAEKIGKLYDLTTEQVFLDIFEKNHWGSTESVSGTGSEKKQVKYLGQVLPGLFKSLEIKAFLDIPCGDFNWMKDINLGSIEYFGGDIVSDLVSKNIVAFKKPNVTFKHLDLLSSDLPYVDLIFCRDCLVHLSFSDIKKAIQNIKRSSAMYLLTTSFVEQNNNLDIKTGQWRALNLMLEPFNFPPPVKTVVEGCTEGDGAYKDKSLCLWRIADLPCLK
tara:strand:+ start:6185 stop:7183 length:999 start_codon:yes stop_codon:yes gene_type:complete